LQLYLLSAAAFGSQLR